MSTSIVRDMCLFTAGLACASAVAIAGINFSDKEPITPQQFEQRAQELLQIVADLGTRVGSIDNGRVGIYSHPPIACTNPPRPTEPLPSVDSRLLKTGFSALSMLNDAYQKGMKEPVYILAKCQPTR
jgi:hypothetical protein